jgi:hypothetical protein
MPAQRMATSRLGRHCRWRGKTVMVSGSISMWMSSSLGRPKVSVRSPDPYRLVAPDPLATCIKGQPVERQKQFSDMQRSKVLIRCIKARKFRIVRFDARRDMQIPAQRDADIGDRHPVADRRQIL